MDRRFVASTVQSALACTPVVSVNGPRRVGKTALTPRAMSAIHLAIGSFGHAVTGMRMTDMGAIMSTRRPGERPLRGSAGLPPSG